LAAPGCRALRALRLRQARIESVEVVRKGDALLLWAGAQPTPAPMGFCRVHGTAHPVARSRIGFEVWLPEERQWNGKFLQVGNGGFAGGIPVPGLYDALARGYAAAGTDGGHQSPDGLDASWAMDHPERITDFGWRAAARTTDAAQRIIVAGLGRKPLKSYFDGCSDGGRDAMMMAQRYPLAFDGIVAGAPAMAWTDLMTLQAIVQRDLAPPRSLLPRSKLPALQAAALAACGAGGYVRDPLQCHFDPAQLLCEGEESDSCLTGVQVQAVRKVYEGAVNPATGRHLPGLEPGAEAQPGNWDFSVLASPTDALGPVTGNPSFGLSFFRYVVRGDPRFMLADLATSDMQRARTLWGKTLDATDPDLHAFRAHGGRLLQYQGWTDALVPPRWTIMYFDSVQRAMGDSSDFYRLFMVPGMNHCAGGTGPWQVDWLATLERWVERGEAPLALRATHPQTAESQSLAPYPAR
jgi:feruloyl esterase